MQKEYDKFKAQASGTEYKARHILVEKEDEAKAIVAQLKAGAKFEDLAKKSSKDPGSAPNGGDLDFASPASYVPEFSQAMVALKKGEYTETPVKTQFGYHIIKLEDTRAAQFPPLADVKPQIQQRLAQQKAAGVPRRAARQGEDRLQVHQLAEPGQRRYVGSASSTLTRPASMRSC